MRREKSRMNPTESSEPDERRKDQRIRRHDAEDLDEIDHRERDDHFRAARNAEHERSGDRVFKERLQQKARERERSAEDRRHEDARQADLPDDVHLRGIAGLGEQDLHNPLERDGDVADVDIQHRDEAEGGNEHEEHERIPGAPPCLMHEIRPGLRRGGIRIDGFFCHSFQETRVRNVMSLSAPPVRARWMSRIISPTMSVA